MISVQFPDREIKRKALGFLAGRFSFTTWESGEVLVPDEALSPLAREGIRLAVGTLKLRFNKSTLDDDLSARCDLN